MATRDERLRLDQPTTGRRQFRPSYDPDAFGRLAELVARYLGTARFLVIQTGLITVWMVLNQVPATTFDGYPFPFLTLILSLQAAYAAPLILLAQNRQDDRDRANMVEDRNQAGRNLEDTEFLARELAEVRIALGEVVTRDFLRAELRELLEEREKPKKVKAKRRRDERGPEPVLVTEPQAGDGGQDEDPAPA